MCEFQAVPYSPNAVLLSIRMICSVGNRAVGLGSGRPPRKEIAQASGISLIAEHPTRLESIGSKLCQLGHAASFIPILDVKIAGLVKAQPVRCGEDSELLLLWRNSEICPLCLVWIVAKE